MHDVFVDFRSISLRSYRANSFNMIVNNMFTCRSVTFYQNSGLDIYVKTLLTDFVHLHDCLLAL